MKKYLILVPTIIVFLGVITLQLHALPALADSAQSELQSGANAAGGGASSPSINSIVATVVNILSGIVGVVAVVMIVIAGFKYVTSGGDEGGIRSAKNTLVYAIVGLVIVVLAQSIVAFVLNKIG